MSQITERDYREYLISLVHMTFKILPLYEEKNEHIVDYIDSVCMEIEGLKELINHLPYDVWYVKSLATLKALKKNDTLMLEHKKVKKEVLKITNLIDKQIDKLRGE